LLMIEADEFYPTQSSYQSRKGVTARLLRYGRKLTLGTMRR
jgi:hypothetical protein